MKRQVKKAAMALGLTAAIAADMGGAMEGSEYNIALWTMALLLFIISLVCIFAIHFLTAKGGKQA